jgi:hypothetical protein
MSTGRSSPPTVDGRADTNTTPIVLLIAAALLLADAARAMADTPAAFQLRLRQAVVDVAAEKNSTLVMPFPVELLRFFDRVTNRPTVTAQAAEPYPAAAHN